MREGKDLVMRHKEGRLKSGGTRRRNLPLSLTAKHLYISRKQVTGIYSMIRINR